jgi:PPOX class F420-dependent enzyme/OxyR family protein
MSVFSEAEIAFLQSKTMGRLATIGADGRPHLIPLTYRFNAEEDAIDIGGINFGNSKKWRDMLQNPRVAFLVDDASPAGAHAIEVRGDAEPHFEGGESINPALSQLQTRVRTRAAAPHHQLGSGDRRLCTPGPNRQLAQGRPTPHPELSTPPESRDQLATFLAGRPVTKARPAREARSIRRCVVGRHGSTTDIRAE